MFQVIAKQRTSGHTHFVIVLFGVRSPTLVHDFSRELDDARGTALVLIALARAPTLVFHLLRPLLANRLLGIGMSSVEPTGAWRRLATHRPTQNVVVAFLYVYSSVSLRVHILTLRRELLVVTA